MNISSTTNSSLIPAMKEESCFTPDPTWMRILRIVPYTTIIPISILGNVIVIWIVYKDLFLHKSVNYFIVNMAISDLLISIVYMPRAVNIFLWGYAWLISGDVGYILCKSVSFLYETAVIVSILTIVAISMDRFFAVIWPLKLIISKRTGKVIILLIWSVALASRLPIPIAIRLVKSNDNYFCFVIFDKVFFKGADMLYHKVTMAVFYVTPLTIIAMAYTGIIITLHRRKILFHTLDQLLQQDRLNRQVLRMVLVVVGTFIFCWLLYFIVAVLRIYHNDIPCDVFYMRMLLAHSNCAINPCLYITLSENYKRGFKKLFKKGCCKRRHNQGTGIPVDNPYMMELTVSNGTISPLSFTLEINPH